MNRRGWAASGRLQTQLRQDLLDDRLLQDRRNDLQLAIAVRAVLLVDLEQPLWQLGPAQAYRAVLSADS